MRELRAGASDSDEDALMAQLGRLNVIGSIQSSSSQNSHENYDNLYHTDNSSPLLLFQPPPSLRPVLAPQQPPPQIITTTTVSSYSTPQPQKAQLVRGEKPPLLPKPGYFATFSSSTPQTTTYDQGQQPTTTNGFTPHSWNSRAENLHNTNGELSTKKNFSKV